METYLGTSLSQGELYLGKLPEELIYIVCTYLKTDSALYDLGGRNKDVYTLYLNNINKGYINPFDGNIPYEIRLYSDSSGTVSTHPSNSPSSRILKYLTLIYELLSHTTNSESIKIHVKTEKNQEFKMNEDYEYSSIKKILYFQDSIVSNTIIFINKKNNYIFVHRIIYIDTKMGEKINIFSSHGWQFIWDKLPDYVRNELLVQNGYLKYFHGK